MCGFVLILGLFPCLWMMGIHYSTLANAVEFESGKAVLLPYLSALVCLCATYFASFRAANTEDSKWSSKWSWLLDSLVLVILLTFCRVAVGLAGEWAAIFYVAVHFCYIVSVVAWLSFNKRWLGIVVLLPLLGIALLFSPKVTDKYAMMNEKREERRVQREEEAEAERIRRQKEAKEGEKLEKLKTFALNHAPAIWETYQKLGSEIDIQVERNARLRDTLVIFRRDPESDNDYLACEAWVEEMRKTRGELLKRLEEAYFAKRKADATPGRADVEALWKKAQEDGIQEAEAAARRFREMTEQK